MALYNKVRFNDRISVSYLNELDGGGLRYGQDYVRFVRQKFGRVDRIFEWCAGPGFIGFSLLAHELCDYLVLADVNKEAVKSCEATIAENGLFDRVEVYHADGLEGLPTEPKWDLVVGNPPHSGSGEVIPRLSHRAPILYMDADWRLHRDFYRAVGRHLKLDGAIAIIENRLFSSPLDFSSMISEAGLENVAIELCAPEWGEDYYYIVTSRPGHVPKAWS